MGRKKLLTKEKIIEVLNRWFVEYGMPPTLEELRKVLKVGSKRTVSRYMEWLEEDGLIEKWQGARGLKLLRGLETGLETRSVPIVGTAPAGPLMTAEENIEGWVRIPKSFFGSQSPRFFLLKVKGDSMNKCQVKGEKIEDGDLVLVRQQAVAKPGDIIVALIDSEATIKRLKRGQGYYILEPESSNESHTPIVVEGNFHVLGIVERVLKRGSDLI